MIIHRSVDIEEEIRKALCEYVTVYCRPLPTDYTLPNILITQVGGSDKNTIDTFEVVLDARAEREAQAMDLLFFSVAILRSVALEQTTAIRYVTVNTSGSWGVDPVRPDLAMCSARISVVAHQKQEEVQVNGNTGS